jgi:hypothetical protein
MLHQLLVPLLLAELLLLACCLLLTAAVLQPVCSAEAAPVLLPGKLYMAQHWQR